MNKISSTIVQLALLGVILSLGGCATLYKLNDSIPGIDRIIQHFSKAEVGPVKTANGEIIQGTETDLLAAENQDAAAETVPKELADQQNLASSLKASKTAHNEGLNSVSTVSPAAISKDSAVLPKTTVKHEVPAKVSVRKSDSVISGNVRLLAKTGTISPEGAMVRLIRLDGAPLQKPVSQASHEIDMIDKTYAPSNVVIRKGDSINFVNSDFIQHNVFSSTGENAFDLGTFGGGLQREVKLNKEGVVKVYCNIHPGMATFIAVDDVGVSKVVKGEDGYFEFLNLPAGDYQLSLWSVRGEQTQQVTLAAKQNLHLDLTFDTSSYQSPEHANKFGESYQKKNIRREFY
jgi:plastocyanin